MENKKMSGKFRYKIREEAQKLCISIPKDIQSGTREVEEDKIIKQICEKYGYELSDFYGAPNDKYCRLVYDGMNHF